MNMLAFPVLAGGNREKEKGGGWLPFRKEKNENILDSQQVLLESSESLNTGPSICFHRTSVEQASGMVPWLPSQPFP
jgi:hypothetical protein